MLRYVLTVTFGMFGTFEEYFLFLTVTFLRYVFSVTGYVFFYGYGRLRIRNRYGYVTGYVFFYGSVTVTDP